MDALEPSWSYMKRDVEEILDMEADRREEEDEDGEGGDKRKHRPSKSKMHDSVEEVEEWNSGGKRKSSSDRHDGRKKSGSSSKAGSDYEDDYNTRKELRAKLAKNDNDERTQRKSSSRYLDREFESGKRSGRDVVERYLDRELESGKRSGRDVVESKGYDHTDENERSSSRKANTKSSSHEISQSRSRSKVDAPREHDHEKTRDRDSRYLEKTESSKEKSHGTRDQERNPRRWDETDSTRRADDSSQLDKADLRDGKVSDHSYGPSRERNIDMRVELGEDKSRLSDSRTDKNLRSGIREEGRVDGERSKSRAMSEAQGEDGREVNKCRQERSDSFRDDKQRRVREKLGGSGEDVETGAGRMSSGVQREKIEKHQKWHNSYDDSESRERSVNIDEDRQTWLRDSNVREVRYSNRSRSLERSARRHKKSDDFDQGFSDSDNERNIIHKGREREKEGYKDNRSKGRDRSWNDRNRDREGSRDNSNRGNQSRRDKEIKDGDGDLDYDKEWDSRHERERMDSDKLRSWHDYRKDRCRTEGAKGSANFGASNERSDTIEIRPKSLDYGREETGLGFASRNSKIGVHPNFTMSTNDEWEYLPEDRARKADLYSPGDDLQERYPDDDSNQNDGMSSDRNNFEMQVARGRGSRGAVNSNHIGAGQASGNSSQLPFGNNLGSGSSSRFVRQGSKGGAGIGRGGRGRLARRDGQQPGIAVPMVGPPFGHINLPAGPMQPIGPNISPAAGPPIGPGVFMPPFAGPIVWPGARGFDMNMLAVPPSLSPLPPPGPLGPRFVPNMGNGPNPAIYFNQPGPVRGISPSIPPPAFNSVGPAGRGAPHDKAPMGWVPPRVSGPPGKAPSRGEQNDYSQNFVDTGMRPQNFIRELELTSVVEDYPRLRELIQKKDEIVAKSASPPMYYKCDLRELVLSPEFFGTKFDVILVDPPWEEYVHRAPGVADNMEYWTFEEIQNLKIEAIADTPSFIFLWVGDGVGLEQGRQCLKKWGFRRCEDICWVKTNKTNATPGLRHDSHTLFQHSKEHCLMGIKGTVRRSTDGHIIHANIDTDIIIAEEPPYGSARKPEDLYRIIEHFSLGRRRLELFGEDHNIRSGWLTVGKGLSSSNFGVEAYVRNFADKDGKVWQGIGGRNPLPDAPHLVGTTPDIESLRPKSPPQKNQQQQSTSFSVGTTANSSNRRPTTNSPQNTIAASPHGLNPEASGSNPPAVPWASPMDGLKGPEVGNVAPDDRLFDGYGANASCGQVSGDHLDFESQRAINLL